MSQWWTEKNKSEVPHELLLEVRYMRYCPECEDFKRQETIVDGNDRILRCDACGSEERFVLANGVLFPEGTLALIKRFARKRALEVLHGRPG